jgi:hypothetical protein
MTQDAFSTIITIQGNSEGYQNDEQTPRKLCPLSVSTSTSYANGGSIPMGAALAILERHLRS